MIGPVIVTGSREWPEYLTIWTVLDAYEPELVVHGGAIGADSMAESWCKRRQVDSHICRPKWGHDPVIDTRAGLVRNVRMLSEYPRALVLAFPFGKSSGTRHCIGESVRRGHKVKVFDVGGEMVEEYGVK